MMARRGRKRMAGQRTKSGQLGRSKAAKEERGVGDVRGVAMQQPHRVWLGDTRRLDQRAVSEIGRMFLAGRLTEAEYWAGERWRRLIQDFHIVLATPMPAGSPLGLMVASKVDGEEESGTAERPETDEERRDRVLVQHKAAMACLRKSGDARAVLGEMERAVYHDVACGDFQALKIGLGALAKLWRMSELEEDGPARVRGHVGKGDKPRWEHEEKEVTIVYK